MAKPSEPGATALASPSPLAQFLATLERPLAYVAQASPELAARAKLPGRNLAERARQVQKAVSDQLTREGLERLAIALEQCEAALASELPERARHCIQLAERLGSDAREGRATYNRRADSLDDDLAAIGQSVQFVPGVGPRRAELLRRFGIATIEELLYHLPFRYEDRRRLVVVRDLRVGELASVRGEITHVAERHVGRMRRRILEVVLRDETGFLALTWFNQVAFFRGRLEKGQQVVVHGKVEGAPGGQKRIVHPEILPATDVEGQGVLPVYEKPTSLSPAAMRKIAAAAVDGWAARLPSVLPAPVSDARNLVDLTTALQRIHQPAGDADVDALNECRSAAHRALVFDELFFLQLGMALRRQRTEKATGFAMQPSGLLTLPLRRDLPFRLTVAQERVLHEIQLDLAKPHPMHRLVQGDVGSGKTMVALLAALVAIECGFQVALMAPTELLAEQHALSMQRLLEPLGVRVGLLTGSKTSVVRKKCLAEILDGSVQLVVGTHAVIQDKVVFHRLGLGIVDEQHRFGVLQRAALRGLGASEAEGRLPHMLLMTATPIPRTLAMSVYGDLDLSTLDQLPPGRKPVRTVLVTEAQRARVYDMVTTELDRGRQAYVVYPLVEASEASPLRDATSMAEELARAVFHRFRVGLLHGKMKPAEKDAVMRRFQAGDLQVLVSTTVIEVGIDVPNATVMVVEHAERFGLAQLHQLRGRVGRGSDASTCVLVAPFQRGDEAHRRLRALVETNDGFRIADVDLEIRGPGDLLGTRQSGLPDFRVANLIRDRYVLEEARRAADAYLMTDPALDRPGSQAIRRILRHRWAGRLGLAEIG